MANTITCSLGVNMSFPATIQDAVDALLTSTTNITAVQASDQLPTGTAAGQVNRAWAKKGATIAGSGTKSYDMSAGSDMTNPDGTVLTFTALKLVVIHNIGTTANTNAAITVGHSASGVVGLGDTGNGQVIPLGGWFVAYAGLTSAGWAVTNSSGDVLLLTAAADAGGAVYDIMIVGVQ